MQILRKIKPTKAKNKSRYGYRTKGTEYTIKEMLVRDGYSEKDIKELKQQGRIFITPSTFSVKLRPSQELVIVGEYKVLAPPDILENRFDGLEEE